MKGEKKTEDLKKRKLNFFPDSEGKDISDLGELLRSGSVDHEELIKEQKHKVHMEIVNQLLDKSCGSVANAGVVLSRGLKTDLGTSYEFTAKEFKRYFELNSSFREIILSGAYIYHKGRVCIIHEDAFEYDGNKFTYSKQALVNPQKYFLGKKYFYEYKVQQVKVTEFGPVGLAKPQKKKAFVHADLFSTIKDFFDADGFGYTTLILNIVKKYRYGSGGGGGGGTSNRFCEVFESYMKDRGFSSELLAEKTGIDKMTIDRMKTSDSYNPSVLSIVACSLVMKLWPWESGLLLYLAGRVLRRSNKVESIYYVMLQCFFWLGDLKYCDEVLAAAKCKTITATIESHKKKAEKSETQEE